MFRIPLIHLQIEEWSSKKSKLLSMLREDSLTQNNLEKVKSNFFRKDKEKDNKKIQSILSTELRIVKTNLGIENLKISNSWFEVAEKEMYHQVHNHGPVGFSSVCFIEYDEDKHNPTQFISPFNNFIDGSILSHSPEHITEGSIIFFPSLIHHYTIPNYSSNKRIILSFNLSIG